MYTFADGCFPHAVRGIREERPRLLAQVLFFHPSRIKAESEQDDKREARFNF